MREVIKIFNLTLLSFFPCQKLPVNCLDVILTKISKTTISNWNVTNYVQYEVCQCQNSWSLVTVVIVIVIVHLTFAMRTAVVFLWGGWGWDLSLFQPTHIAKGNTPTLDIWFYILVFLLYRESYAWLTTHVMNVQWLMSWVVLWQVSRPPT